MTPEVITVYLPGISPQESTVGNLENMEENIIFRHLFGGCLYIAVFRSGTSAFNPFAALDHHFLLGDFSLKRSSNSGVSLPMFDYQRNLVEYRIDAWGPKGSTSDGILFLPSLLGRPSFQTVSGYITMFSKVRGIEQEYSYMGQQLRPL